VLPTRLDRLLDIRALAELVPRLNSQDVAAAGDCLLQVSCVARAALAIDVEAVPLGSSGAVLRVLETGPDLRDRQLGRGVEAEWRRATRTGRRCSPASAEARPCSPATATRARRTAAVPRNQ